MKSISIKMQLIRKDDKMAISINGVTVAGNGKNGAPATINGVNALTLKATGGLTGQQSGDTYTIDGSALVPNTTMVNGQPLSGNVNLTANDVGADSQGSADNALISANSYSDSIYSSLSTEIMNIQSLIQSLDSRIAALGG